MVHGFMRVLDTGNLSAESRLGERSCREACDHLVRERAGGRRKRRGARGVSTAIIAAAVACDDLYSAREGRSIL